VPFKICPQCGTQTGPRTLYCHFCQAPFEKTLKKFGHTVPVNTNTVNVNVSVAPSGKVKAQTINPKVFSDSCGELNLEPHNLFDDLYGKSEAVSIVMSALSLYNMTNGRSRVSNLICGGPASGKSEILNRFEQMLGRENVLRVNSETSTKAGIENEILNYPGNLPPVLMLEEIEKTQSDLSWLLGILDGRGELIKVTAKEGMQRRRVPFICIATCNSLKKLEQMHSGSIASRFSNKIFIKDIDSSTMYQILLNKLKQIPNYDPCWIEPAIECCRQTGEFSIRRAEAILLCGQERLMDGSYQATLRATSQN
jgi:hypothetical protein